jgi:hypothetical protein
MLETAETTAPVRSLALAGSLGHIELIWDKDADEKVRPVIEKYIAQGVRFFRVDTTGFLNLPRRLRKIEDLKRQRINIADADIETLAQDGLIQLERLEDGEYRVLPGTPTVDEIVQGNTMATRQFHGG